MTLPALPIFLEEHFSKNQLQIINKDDGIIWDLITTIKIGWPMGIYGLYIKNYEKDLHTRFELLLLDKKFVVSAAICGAFRSMLHESDPSELGMNNLVESF